MAIPIPLLLALATVAGASPPPTAVTASLTAGGEPTGGLELRLDSGVAASWADAQVGLLVLRDTGGQRALLPAVPPKTATLEVPLEAVMRDGCGLVVGELGPGVDDERPAARAVAWRQVTRTVKLFLCRDAADPAVGLAARRALTPIATAKAGTLVEIRPLANPLTVPARGDLPVRLYADQMALAGATVTAHGPDGATIAAQADASGIAILRLGAAGRWRLELVTAIDGVARHAEVVFETLPRELSAAAGEAP